MSNPISAVFYFIAFVILVFFLIGAYQVIRDLKREERKLIKGKAHRAFMAHEHEAV